MPFRRLRLCGHRFAPIGEQILVDIEVVVRPRYRRMLVMTKRGDGFVERGAGRIDLRIVQGRLPALAEAAKAFEPADRRIEMRVQLLLLFGPAFGVQLVHGL